MAETVEMLPEIIAHHEELADPAPTLHEAPKPPIPTVSPETSAFLEPYLPPPRKLSRAANPKLDPKLDPTFQTTPTPSTPDTPQTRPHVTLTYATSLDSHLALEPGLQTALSGPLSKSLTHYLRSRHDGILIGVGTATADDPGLNCRLEGVGGYSALEQPEDPTKETPFVSLDDEDDIGESDPLPGQPRPIILDPNRRWHFTRDSRIFKTVREGQGKAPIILTRASSRQGPGEAERWRILCEHGGLFMCPKDPNQEEAKDKSKRMKTASRWSWNYLLEFLYTEAGIKSLMIEGGGEVINDLLGQKENLALIDSVVLTIAPIYLGKGGVNVSPMGKIAETRKAPAVAFKDVKWSILGNDAVMAARPALE